jgi:hypothetical protein
MKYATVAVLAFAMSAPAMAQVSNPFMAIANEACQQWDAYGHCIDPGQDPGQKDPGQHNPGQHDPGQKPGHGDDCKDGKCTQPTKDECFNVSCSYENEDEHGIPHTCKAVSTFTKAVTLDGGEVEDDSTIHNNPSFEVSCDGQIIYNNSARRYTGLLGTRIQGETGPFPGIFLPRGALHGNAPDDAGYHVAVSYLQVDTPSVPARLRGQCEIWTGNP